MRSLWSILKTCALVLMVTVGARAQKQSIVYTFEGGNNGANSYTGLVFDRGGRAYGTTLQGGTGTCNFPYPLGCGTVFELVLVSDGTNKVWAEHVIYSFQGGSDGAYPLAPLAIDEAGNLYGTTYNGGGDGCIVAGCGTIFELQRVEHGWREEVLYRFTDVANGANPSAGLILDRSGNLYGTTCYGGNQICNQDGPGCGTVFELLRPDHGSASAWKETVLHAFDKSDGECPLSSVIFDDAGNLYGNTLAGGHGMGVIFELTPTAARWTETILHNFSGAPDSGEPVGQLLLDRLGNVYGVTEADGLYGLGGVFELQKSGSTWMLQYLHSFDGFDGWFPVSGVIPDREGNLYGTTPDGGEGSCQYQCGVVYRLNRRENWSDTVLYYFQGGSDGYWAYGSLALYHGDLYGTSVGGGDLNCSALLNFQGCGVVFRISP